MICYWDKLDSPIDLIHLAATDEGLVCCNSLGENGWKMNETFFLLEISRNSIMKGYG